MASGSSRASVSLTSSPMDSTESSPTPTAASGTQTQVINIDDLEDQPAGKRQKKSTSDVWTGNHYNLYFRVEEVDGKKAKVEWASCNHCNYKRPRDSKNGTSVFRNHLKTHDVVAGQQQLKVDKKAGETVAAPAPYKYDQDVSLRLFYMAIIMHEYPFIISEHEYFIEFIKSLRPTFPMKSRITVRKDIMAIFVEEKNKLYEHLKTVNSRISATMDMWTSNQNKGYMCVTIHWIDENWNMQKRIISFMHLEGRHTGINMSDAFCASMTRRFIDKKMFFLTLDNVVSNEVVVNDVVAEIKKKSPLVCDGLFFHVRCACHVLNLVARDGLKQIATVVWSIRMFIMLVKCSPSQWENFIKCAAQCGLDTKSRLLLDIQTRWNSTYHLLKDALFYRKTFDRLYDLDKKRYSKVAPSKAEWNMAETFCKCLKRFDDVTVLLLGTSYPIENLFYQSFAEVNALIKQWCTSEDEFISKMANSMNTKFEKYWKKSNVALAVAYFLDPRYRKRGVEYLMRNVYGPLLYRAKVEEFVIVVKQMYASYAAASRKSDEPNSSGNVEASKDDITEDESNFMKFLYESNDGADDGDASDLDKYMSEHPLKLTKSSSIMDKFDILSWWKTSGSAYPILSLLARDVLAIQASTVSSESAFSAGGRVVDSFRSRLDPEMVEALICTKDRVVASQKDSNRNVASILNDLEVAEIAAASVTMEDLEEQDKQMSSDDD